MGLLIKQVFCCVQHPLEAPWGGNMKENKRSFECCMLTLTQHNLLTSITPSHSSVTRPHFYHADVLTPFWQLTQPCWIGCSRLRSDKIRLPVFCHLCSVFFHHILVCTNILLSCLHPQQSWVYMCFNFVSLRVCHSVGLLKNWTQP